MAAKYFKNRKQTPIQQYVAFMQKYPEWKLLRKHTGFIARGRIQPTALSAKYNVEIRYSEPNAPKVRILHPKLLSVEEGGKIKHTYSDGSLCLYYPPNREWTSAHLIADTFVDWTSLWLYHYEIWHATGEWLGGGIEH